MNTCSVQLYTHLEWHVSSMALSQAEGTKSFVPYACVWNEVDVIRLACKVCYRSHNWQIIQNFDS